MQVINIEGMCILHNGIEAHQTSVWHNFAVMNHLMEVRKDKVRTSVAPLSRVLPLICAPLPTICAVSIAQTSECCTTQRRQAKAGPGKYCTNDWGKACRQ